VRINVNQTYPKLPTSFDCESKQELLTDLNRVADKVGQFYSQGDFYLGIDEVMRLLRSANLIFHNEQPWKTVKEDDQALHLQHLLALVYETLRVSAILLWPIVPQCSETVLRKLNCDHVDQLCWSNAKPIDRSPITAAPLINQTNLIVYNKVR
jgi:methionyl-tRNA synthetase